MRMRETETGQRRKRRSLKEKKKSAVALIPATVTPVARSNQAT